MAKHIINTADSRGHADHGWLKTYHSFSFANYFNPERVHFGALRVLNDDYIAGSMGFGMHPHNNMEIVSIPLKGTLSHQDSMGSKGTIQKGEIQIMSAGTGVFHSEVNASEHEAVTLLQIWVIPNRTNVTPRYGQMNYQLKQNELKTLIQPTPSEDTLWLHQDAWFKLAKFDAKQAIKIPVEMPETNGLYLFVIEGKISVNENVLETRDAIGIWETEEISVETLTDTEFLIIEIPMLTE